MGSAAAAPAPAPPLQPGGERARALAPLVWEELPSDAVLALEALRPYVLGAFPLPVFPLSVLSGHVGQQASLTLRRELSVLAAAGSLRELRLLGGEEVVALSKDFGSYLSAEGAGAGSEKARALAFFSSLAAAHPTAHVSEADVAVAYRAWLASVLKTSASAASASAASASAASASAASASASASASARAATFGLDGTIKELLGLGLLFKKPTPGVFTRDFYFGVPGGARLGTCLKAGREELLAKLRKAPGRQLPREHILKKQLKCSPFPSLFHLRDALGLGLVSMQHTSDGVLIRWCAS